jgi:hypothetical protein
MGGELTVEQLRAILATRTDLPATIIADIREALDARERREVRQKDTAGDVSAFPAAQ